MPNNRRVGSSKPYVRLVARSCGSVLTASASSNVLVKSTMLRSSGLFKTMHWTSNVHARTSVCAGITTIHAEAATYRSVNMGHDATSSFSCDSAVMRSALV